MSLAARGFISAVVVCGTSVLTYTVLHGTSRDPLKFFCYLVIALVASRLKVNLPGITGTMSVNFLFLLLGVLELSFSETMAARPWWCSVWTGNDRRRSRWRLMSVRRRWRLPLRLSPIAIPWFIGRSGTPRRCCSWRLAFISFRTRFPWRQ